MGQKSQSDSEKSLIMHAGYEYPTISDISRYIIFIYFSLNDPRWSSLGQAIYSCCLIIAVSHVLIEMMKTGKPDSHCPGVMTLYAQGKHTFSTGREAGDGGRYYSGLMLVPWPPCSVKLPANMILLWDILRRYIFTMKVNIIIAVTILHGQNV